MVYQCKNVGCMKIVRDLAKTDQRVIGSITGRLAEPDAAAALARPSVDTSALRDPIDTLRKQITATTRVQRRADHRQRMNARIDRINEKLAPLQDKLLGAHMSRDVKDLAENPTPPIGSPHCRWTGGAQSSTHWPPSPSTGRQRRVDVSTRRRSPSTGSDRHPTLSRIVIYLRTESPLTRPTI